MAQPGKQYGKITAIRPTTQRAHRSIVWDCICECGITLVLPESKLWDGKYGTQSCGCSRRKAFKYSRGFTRVYAQYKASAKKRRHEFTLSKAQFMVLTQNECFYCGTEPQQISIDPRIHDPEHQRQHTFRYNGIDRVDNTVGYSISNCVSCCRICNIMKNNLTLSEFYSQIKKIAERISNGN